MLSEKYLQILIVDDYSRTLDATANALPARYRSARIIKVRTAREAKARLERALPDLAIIDLSLPENFQTNAGIYTGIQLLRTVMKKYSFLNLAINEALPDEEIARRMNMAQETICHYWNEIQDILDVYVDGEERKETEIDLRSLLAKRAREEGWLD